MMAGALPRQAPGSGEGEFQAPDPSFGAIERYGSVWVWIDRSLVLRCASCYTRSAGAKCDLDTASSPCPSLRSRIAAVFALVIRSPGVPGGRFPRATHPADVRLSSV